MRAIFFGTPEIAVPSLHALAEVAEIKGVVCQPDRPSGRGLKVQPPAVKRAALEMGLEVLQPVKVRDGSLERFVVDRAVDVALVIAYGRILPREVLGAPRLGCVNLHASLLPSYRGAAPIQRALMAGEPRTGVCLMQMDEGMDTGDVLSVRELEIDPSDNGATLATKLGELAAQITREDLPRLFAGALVPTPQDHSAATYAAPITSEDTRLDFSLPAAQLANLVRGLAPRPGAFAELHREGDAPKRLRILAATPMGDALAPGLVRAQGRQLLVGTAAGSLSILEAQLEGRKPQLAQDLINGRSVRDGDRLGVAPP